jgi:McrBC 5-methylcytosine restriction system component
MKIKNLKDNTCYTSTRDNLEEYLSLKYIANCPISDLLDQKGNSLLVFPHSFRECEDEIGKETIFSLLCNEKGKHIKEAVLKTGNLAGFIGTNDQYISIHSRFSEKPEDDFFLHYMLQKVLNINLVNLAHSTADEQIFDFLLYLFPKALNEALQQGLYKEYQRNEYNDANLRGVIDINRNIKKNFPFNGRIAYRTREFSHDNSVTELIRHTIEYISAQKRGSTLLENDVETRGNISLIISATPNYKRQDREQVVNNNRKTANHPYFTRYISLQKICLRILRHEKLKYGHRKEEIYGIMFDVSWLWEEYLGSILMKKGFKHPNNRKRKGRIYLADNTFPRYPDFYDKEDHGIVIDAKYKSCIGEREDINQMLTYMYRLKSKWGIFIQPVKDLNQKICTYQLYGYGADDNAKLQIHSFQVPQKAKDYEMFEKLMKKSEDELIKRIDEIM